jgi:penicillin-binding protein 1B
MTLMKRRWGIWTAVAVVALVTPSIIVGSMWVYRLNERVATRLRERRFAPPIEFWNQGQTLRVGSQFDLNGTVKDWRQEGYRQRTVDQVLFPGDYALLDASECLDLTESSTQEFAAGVQRCLAFNLKNATAAEADTRVQIVAVDAKDTIQAIWRGTPPAAVPHLELAPQIFAEFYGNDPILRREVKLGDTPPICLNALLAIEDSDFLQHQGINFTALARALMANLTSGRYAQGGSTITQQLVKNYFLTADRTLKRKVTEIVMSVLLEAHLSKDEILETYINLIYMGQNGPFQIRGFGSAAEHYFGTPLEELNLPQCALLAAILNSPGLFNPFTRPDAALQRRQRVLSRMQELNYIDAGRAQAAEQSPLPIKPSRELLDPAPYFVDAVLKFLRANEIDTSEGLRVYTTMNPLLQFQAQNIVEQELAKLSEKQPKLKALQAEGKYLEGLLIAVENSTGDIKAVVGGRNFRKTQFNRAVDARRQIGSIMKPFVFLAALEKEPEGADPFSPWTLIDDSKFTVKERKKSWSPENYDKIYRGTVPAFYALSQSLNSATAKLGLDVGLEKVINVAERAGITAVLLPVPSLSLGSFEVLPLEVAESMVTLARFGSHLPLSLIRSIETLEGEVIYRPNVQPDQRFSASAVASLVSMMKQTMVSGTARSVQSTLPTINAAGKTGTTSDLKDAWFAGFTPEMTVITWVGFDDNTSTTLTGASGALPLWVQFFKQSQLYDGHSDFPWPDEAAVTKRILSKEELATLVEGWQGPDSVELIAPKAE